MEETAVSELVFILSSFSIILFAIAFGVVFLSWRFRNNLYKEKLEQETLKLEHQRALLQNAIDVQEEERKRIAKDLHDELGAVLSMSRMWLLQAEQQKPVKQQKIAEIRNLVENALSATRRISHELMPLHLSSLGLERALKSLTARAGEVGELEVRLSVEGPLDTLPGPLELGIFRILSELINNTLKHAEATTIDIRILFTSNQLVCVYADNGRGLSDNHDEKGLGLKNLEGRINALNGSWDYGSRDEGGFYAKFEVSIHNNDLHTTISKPDL